MTCTVTRYPLANSFRARLRAAHIEAVFSNDQRTELEQLLRCNVAADPFDPNQPDPPRVAPLPARDGGAPHVVSPPEVRRATPSEDSRRLSLSRCEGSSGPRSLQRGERGSGGFRDHSRPVREWIEGLAGLILLFGGLYALQTLVFGAGQ